MHISLIIPTKKESKARCFRDNNQKIKNHQHWEKDNFLSSVCSHKNDLSIFLGIVIYILVILGNLFKPFFKSLIPKLCGFGVLFI